MTCIFTSNAHLKIQLFSIIDNLEELNPKPFRSMAENFYKKFQKSSIGMW